MSTMSILYQILGVVSNTNHDVELLKQAVLLQNKKLDTILNNQQSLPHIRETLHEIVIEETALKAQLRALAERETEDFQKILSALDTIQSELTPSPAITFVGTVTHGDAKEKTLMTKLAAKVGADLSVQDDGSVNVSFNAVDKIGVQTAWPDGVSAPTLAEVDPDGAPGPSFDVANATLSNTLNGFTYNVKVLASPPQPLVTGIQFTGTVPSGFPNQTDPIVVTAAPPVDIVAGPASTFVASESV